MARVARRASPFTQIALGNLGTTKDVVRRLQRELELHLRGKRSIDDLVERIQKVIDVSQHRAELIARTEKTRVQNEARFEAVRNENRKSRGKKTRLQWVTKHDGRQRESHDSMSGQVRSPTEYFISGAGNRLLYPGDPNAPASEICNCRCYIRRVPAKE